MTPLHIAIPITTMKRLFIDTMSNKKECLELLLSHGADANMKNNVGNRITRN